MPQVLVVDDSKTFRAALAGALALDGCEVIEAASGDVALGLVAAQPIDCVVMDLMMPGMSGEEAGRRLKQSAQWSHIPLVILSTRDDAETMVRAFDLGADDYIAKSTSLDVVRLRVRAQLRRKQNDDDHRRLREELLVQTRAALDRARQQLAADALLRAVAEGTTDAVYVKDREGRYLLINTAGARLLGKGVAEVLGRDDRAFFPFDEAEAIRDADRALMDSGATRTTEEPRLVGTATRTLLVTKGPHRDESGRVVGLIGIAHDISDRKRAEEGQRFLGDATIHLAELLEGDAGLEAVARLAATRLAQGCLIHLATDESLRPVAAVHAQPAREAAMGEALAQPARAQAIETVVRAAMEPREGARAWRVSAGNDGEVPAAIADLGARAYACVPMVAHGRALGAITLLSENAAFDPVDLGVATELARRAAMAVDNARLYRQSTEAVHARDDFLAIASHELKTPLAALVLQAQSLQSLLHEPSGNPELALLADRVVRHAGRLGSLVERLLDVSRISTGRLDLEPEDVDLAEVIADVARRHAEPARLAGCTLSLAAASRTVGLWDRLRLDQIVTNLLTNALKYGAGKPIELALSSDETRARLTVRDHGIGIAPEDAQRIFRRFERAVPARDYGGLGLGLYITRQVVEAHGGTISVESAPGAGATFIVELPRRSPQLAARPRIRNLLRQP